MELRRNVTGDQVICQTVRLLRISIDNREPSLSQIQRQPERATFALSTPDIDRTWSP